MITVRYSSVDGFRQTRQFKTLAGARAYAQKWVGPTPDLGGWYAVSFDGIGKVEVAGVSIKELFGMTLVDPVVGCALPIDPNSDPDSDWEGPSRYT